MAILKSKNAVKRKSLSVKIDGFLHEEVSKIVTEASDKGLIFDVAEIVEKALVQAVKQAREELEKAV